MISKYAKFKPKKKNYTFYKLKRKNKSKQNLNKKKLMTVSPESVICILNCLKSSTFKNILEYKGDTALIDRINYSAFVDKTNNKYHTLGSLFENGNIILILLEFVIVNWYILKEFQLNTSIIKDLKKDDLIDIPKLISNIIELVLVKPRPAITTNVSTESID